MNVDHEAYLEIVQFLYKEAELLDEGLLNKWLGLLTDDVKYEIPVRVSKEKLFGSGVLLDSHYIYDDRRALQTKVEKFLSEYSWSEDPPSRTRHLITNIVAEPGDKPQEVRVRSSVLFLRNRLDKPYTETVSYQRRDVLRKTEDGWKLARRMVILDHTVLLSENITILY